MKPTFQHSRRSHQHGGLPTAISSAFRRCGTAGSLGLASVLILLLLLLYAGQGSDSNGSSSNNNNSSSGSSVEAQAPAQAQHTVVQPPQPAHAMSSTGISRPPNGPSNAIDPLTTVQTSNISLKPNRITLGGRQVLYQFPPNDPSQPSPAASCSNGHLKGVLFLYHGCGRTAMSFFYSPQGRDMMQTALSAGLAVVAFEKEGSCWSSSVDLDVSISTGTEWIGKYLVDHCGEDFAKNGSSKVPMFGFGASSGGSFVAEVAGETAKKHQEEGGTVREGFQLAAINVQIMTPHVAIQTPTVFTVMSRDEFTLQGVEHMVSELQRGDIPTLLIKTQPKRMTAEYLLERFQNDEQFTNDIAKGIVGDLRQMGAIAEDGELIQNPRSVELDPLFAKYPKPTGGAFGVSSKLWEMMTPSERDDASQLWLVEELNVAYDQHEITYEKFGDIIGFFFSQSQGTAS